MNNQQQNKVPATVHLVTNIAEDGFIELIVDVTGGFVFRDRLKAAGFRFVRDRFEGLEAKSPEDKTGVRKPATAWRRILVAVPPEVTEDRAVKGVEMAIDELGEMLKGMLEDSRVKGAKDAAMCLSAHWDQSTAMKGISDTLSSMDTPWDNRIPRPPFAA